MDTNARRNRAAALLSLASNATLAVVKLLVGLVTGSVAVLSDAANSAGDLVASGIAFAGVRAAARPADEDHPYGHERSENLAALVEGLLVLAAGGAVAVEAIRRLIAGSDGLVSLDVAVGVAIALYVVVVGARIAWRAGQILIDQALPDEEMHLISATLDEFAEREGVGFPALRARRSGTKRHVDMHMVVDPDTTVREGHALTGRVKRAVQRALPDSEVLIHLEDHD